MNQRICPVVLDHLRISAQMLRIDPIGDGNCGEKVRKEPSRKEFDAGRLFGQLEGRGGNGNSLDARGELYCKSQGNQSSQAVSD